jgi:hypothetical protein
MSLVKLPLVVVEPGRVAVVAQSGSTQCPPPTPPNNGGGSNSGDGGAGGCVTCSIIYIQIDGKLYPGGLSCYPC